MAYKKYVNRNGKLYGPYYYTSIRKDGGTVSSVYLGTKPPKKAAGNHKFNRVFAILLAIFTIPLLVFSNNVTGFLINASMGNLSALNLSFLNFSGDNGTHDEVMPDPGEGPAVILPPTGNPENDSEGAYPDDQDAQGTNAGDGTGTEPTEIPADLNLSVENTTNMTSPADMGGSLVNDTAPSNDTTAPANETTTPANDTTELNQTSNITGPGNIKGPDLLENLTGNYTDTLNQSLAGQANETWNATAAEPIFETTVQEKAVIGKPVRWVRTVRLSGPSDTLRLNLPRGSKFISLNKTSNGKSARVSSRVVRAEKKHGEEGTAGLPALSDGEYEEIILQAEENITEAEVVFETDPPVAEETSGGDRKKTITISSDFHYTDVLSYTSTPIEAPAEKIRLFWMQGGSRTEVVAKKKDTNGNGLVDYIEWVVPSLSSQTYELIIETSRAEHLDEDRNMVSDIFDKVKAPDGTWSETIPEGHYVRVTFERPLDNTRDMTIYARSNGSAGIAVFLNNSDEEIARFTGISAESWYKVYLNNLTEGESHDTFDLKILDADIDFDYIVDPDYPPGSVNVSECSILGIANTYYTMNQSITNNTLQTACINITAENVTVDCNEFFIKSDDAVSGVYSNQYNSTIKNCNITTNNMGGNGIKLDGANISYVYNNTLKNNEIGIFLNFSHNTTIEKNNASSNDYGIYVELSNDTVIINNTASENKVGTNSGIYLKTTCFSNITNNTANSNYNSGIFLITESTNNIINNNYAYDNHKGISIEGDGSDSNKIENNIVVGSESGSIGNPCIYVGSNRNTLTGNSLESCPNINLEVTGHHNNFINNSMYNCCSDPNACENGQGCIVFDGGQNNTLSGGILNLSGQNMISFGYAGAGGSHNIVRDVSFIGNCTNYSYSETNAMNNTLINTSFNISKEYVQSGSQLIRKWYYMPYVNDSVGNNLTNVNVTAHNTSGNLHFSLLTGSDGYTNQTEIPDYVNNGTDIIYHSNYTIYANLSSYINSSHKLNVTLSTNKLDDYFTLTDSVPPTITINTPLNSTANSDAFNFTYSDVNCSSYSVDDTANVTNCSINNNMWYGTLASLSDGYHNISVYANDTVGNLNYTIRYWTRDTDAPDINLLYPANNSNLSVTWLNITGTANDTHNDTVYTNNTNFGSNQGNFTDWNFTYESIPEGSYSILITANDTVGNTNSTEVHFRIDRTAPVITVVSPLNNTNFNSSSIQFNVSLNEATSWCAYDLNGSGNTTMTQLNSTYFNSSISNLNDGLHNITFWCNDTLNQFSQSGLYFFLIDTTIPEIQFVLPTPGNASSQGNTDIYVNMTSSDTNDHYSFVNFDNSLVLWIRGDDTNQSTGSLGAKFYDLSSYGNNGSAIGNATQVMNGKFGKSFDFDGIGDYIEINDSDTVLDFNNSLNYSWSSWMIYHDFPSNLQCYISKDICSGKCSGFNLCVNDSGGQNEISVCTLPNNGNWNCTGTGSNIVKNIWIYSTIVYNGSGGWDIYINGDYNGTASIIASSDLVSDYYIGAGVDTGQVGQNPHYFFNGTIDEVLIFNRSLSSTEIQSLYNASAYQYQKNFTNLTEGIHRFTGYAIDIAANKNETETRFVTLDFTAPTITINTPANSTINSDFFNITYSDVNCSSYSVDDGSNTTNCTINNNMWSGTLASLSDGSHNITVYANDSSGNLNSTTRYWTRDTAAPSINITFPANFSNLSISWINITGEASDANNDTVYINDTNFGSNLGSYQSWNFTNSSLSEGFYSLLITANDTAGSTNSTEVHFRIDRTAPAITTISPTNKTYSVSSVYFNISSNEALSQCHFSLDNWATNTTMNSLNSTYYWYLNSSVDDGSQTAEFWCNDSSGNINGTENLSFFVETGANITKCRELNKENMFYDLLNDVSGSENCFNITYSNITLQCGGYKIQGSLNGSGITAENISNMTIKNCMITNFTRAISIHLVNDSGFDNLTIYSNSQGNISSIFADSCHLNNFTGSNISFNYGNNNSGIYLYNSGNNRIQNVVFENNTVYFNGSGATTSVFGGGIIALVNESQNNGIIDNVFNYNNVTTVGTADSISGGGIVGAYYNSSFNQLINNSFKENFVSTKDIQGGGIFGFYLNSSGNFIENTTFIRNRIFATRYIWGGGVAGNYLYSRDNSLRNSYFYWNTVNSSSWIYGGGGIIGEVDYCYNSSYVNTTIDSNIVEFNGRCYGGGVFGFRYSEGLNVTQTEIVGNNVTALGYIHGGGIFGFHHSPGISNNTCTDIRIINNTVASNNYVRGGGVLGTRASSGFTLKNAHIEGNLYNTSSYVYGGGVIGFLGDETTSRTYNNFINCTVKDNIIYVGTTLTGGIAIGLYGQEYGNVSYNTIIGNNITKTTSTSGMLGMYISNFTILQFNNISSVYNSSLYVNAGNSNNFSVFYINNSYNNVIVQVDEKSYNNRFTNITIENTDPNYFDFRIHTAGINGTVLEDTDIGKYYIEGQGGIINFIKSGKGGILFLQPINGTGPNLSGDVIIENNFISVNSTGIPGLNKSANITFYNMPQNFTNPAIFRNGAVCPAYICYNFTSLNSSTVIINVSHWTNYSIEETPDSSPPTMTINKPLNSTTNSDTFNVTFGETVNWSAYELDSNGTNETIGAVSTFQTTLGGLSDGSHNITVCANDTAGNTNCTIRYWTRDTDTPDINLVFPSNNSNLSITWINITGTASDTNNDTIYTNNTNFGSNTGNYTDWNFTNTSMSEGSYSLLITANDTAGNTNGTVVHFRIDRTAPTITIVSPTNKTYSVSSVYFNISSNEALSQCHFSLDNWATNTTMNSIDSTHFWYLNSSVDNSSFTAKFWCNDTTGNENGTVSRSFSVETGTNVTNCRELNEGDAMYYLTQNIKSEGTCINISANNITLDCQGYEINYSYGGSNGYGVYSYNVNSSSVKNCTIKEGVANIDDKYAVYFSLSHNGSIIKNKIITIGDYSYGIVNEMGSNNEITENNITTSGYKGVGIYSTTNSLNNNISGNIIATSDEKGYGIWIADWTDNAIIERNNITTSGRGGECIYLLNTTNATVSNNIANYTDSDASYVGDLAAIILISSANNSIHDNIIETATGNHVYGIYLTAKYTQFSILSNYNKIFNNNITTKSNLVSYGYPAYTVYLLSGASHNLFYDNIISGKVNTIRIDGTTRSSLNNTFINNTIVECISDCGSNNYDVYLATSSSATFLNVSYNSSREYVTSNSQLTRKWYVNVNVTNSTGDSLQNINVSFRNSTNILIDYNTTQSNGFTRQFELTEYVNTSTTTYWMPYTLYANDSTGTYQNYTNSTVNFSTNIQLDIVMQEADKTAPEITFLEPTPDNETTTDNYTHINLSISEPGSCLLEWNGTNESMSNLSENFYVNKTSLNNGNYTFLAWCNDTAGNLNQSETRWVYINWTPADTTAPDITIIKPLNSTINSDLFNFTYSDINCSSYSVDGGSNTTNCSINNNMWSGTLGSLSDGYLNITVYANDSVGNLNSTTRYWTRDTTPPSINITFPANFSNLSITWINITGTANDTHNDTIYTNNTNFGSNQGNYTNWNFTYNSIPEGTYSLLITANDTAGNTNSTEVHFRIDRTAPTITIVSPTNKTYSTGTVYFNVSVSPDTESCVFALDEGWLENYTMSQLNSSYFWYYNSSVDDGYYTARFLCNDTTGNENGTEFVGFGVETGENVTICRVLGQANTVYTQQADIVPSVSTGSCINITAENVTFDCSGKNIYNATTEGTFGEPYVIYSDKSGTVIKNCNISLVHDIGTGIYLQNANDSYLFNNTVSETRNGYQFINSGNLTIDINNVTKSHVGFYIINVNSSNFTNIVSNSNYGGFIVPTGFYLDGESNLIENITTNNNGIGISTGGSNNVIYDVTANSNGFAIQLQGSMNSLEKISIWNCTGDYYGCIYMGATAQNNSISQTTVNLSASYGIYVEGDSDSNNLSAVDVYQSAYGDVYVAGDNNMINGTFHSSDVAGIEMGGEGKTLYLQGNVIPSGVGINVTAQNATIDCLDYSISNASDDSSGIYSNQLNTTIRNCKITMGSGSSGIDLYEANLSVIFNNTLSMQYIGLQMIEVFHSNVSLNNISNNYEDGIYSEGGGNNNITGNYISGNDDGIQLVAGAANTNNNIIANNTIEFNPGGGLTYGAIWIDGSGNKITDNYLRNNSAGIGIMYGNGNQIINNTIEECFDTCITLQQSDNNPISGTNVYSSNPEGSDISLVDASGNNITNCSFSVHSLWLSTNSVNNVLLNTSYDADVEDIESGSQLIRKWYVSVNVTNSTGDSLQNINVSFRNSTNILIDYNTTQSSGFTRQFELTEYVNTSTNTYAKPYTLYANDSSWTYQNHTNTTVNFTTNIRLDIVMQLVDKIPPNITINKPINSTINSDLFNFTYSDVNCSSYSVDGGANVTNCSITSNMWSATLASLSDGYHNITVYANDTAGNLNSTIRYWTRETDAPDINPLYPANNSNLSVTWINITGTANDTHNDTIYTNNTNFGSNQGNFTNWNFTYNSIPEGVYSLLITANDTAGNINSTEVHFRIDKTGPIYTNIANLTVQRNESLNYDINATDIVGVSCFSVNDTGNFIMDCSGLLTNATSLPVGLYWLSISVNDSIGNTNSQEIYVNVTEYDFTPPDVSITYPSNTTYYNVTHFNFTLSESAVACWYNTGSGNTTIPCQNSTQISIAEGQHTLEVYSNDSANNIGGDSVIFTLDQTPPFITFFPPTPNNETTTSNYSYINLSITEPGTCLLNWNGTNESMSNISENFYKNKTGLNNVNYSFLAWCNDTIGNLNNSETRWVYINFTPPDTEPPVFIDISNITIQRNESLSYDINATDPSGTSCFTVNDTTSFDIGCSGVLTNRTSLSTGIYWLNITVNDTAGNINYKPIYVNITEFDFIAPTLLITYPENRTYYNVTHFNFTLSESAVACWYNTGSGNTTIPCQNSTQISIAEGQHTLEVYANDSANNIGGSSVVFILDQTPPSITIIKPINSTINSDLFNFTYSDVNCSSYSVDGGSNTTNCTINNNMWSGTLASLSDGSHNITVYANDSAGNLNSSIRYWTRDTDAPDINLLYPANNSNLSVTWINITGTASDTNNDSIYTNNTNFGSNQGNYTDWNFTNTSISEGMFSLLITANDTAGNMNSTEVHFRIDRTAPFITVTYPSNASYYNVTHFNFTVSETPYNCWYNAGSGNETISCNNNSALSLSEGARELEVYANDSAGNIGGDAVVFTIDQIPPAITFIPPTPNNETATNNYTYINLSISETGYCLLDWNGTNQSMPNVSQNYYLNKTPLNNGNYSFLAWCNDTTGNLNQSETRWVYINYTPPDTTPPAITINKPINSTISDDTFNVTFGETVNWSAYELNSNGTNETMGAVSSYQTTLGGLSDGQHNITVWANDSSGNMNVSIRYWTRDTDAPDITDVANGSVYAIRAHILWNTTELSNSTVLIGANTTDLEINASNSSPTLSHNLTVQYLAKNTTYYYNVTSCDASGNCNLSGTYNFTTPECASDWQCGSWSACSGGQQSRSCTDANYCQFPWDATETQSCQAPVQQTPSGGSWTGGSILPPPARQKTADFSVYPEIIKVDIKKGEFFSWNITVTNRGETGFNITVIKDGAVSEMMTLAQESFELGVNQSRSMNIKVYADAGQAQDTYMGHVVFEGRWMNGTMAAVMQREVLLVVDIKEKKPMLDVRAEIQNSNKELQIGEELSSQISAFNFGEKRADLALDYVIMDENGRIIYSRSETIAVETQASMVRSFQLPKDISAGNYVFSVMARYGNETSRASDVFRVVEERKGVIVPQIPLQLLAEIMLPALLICDLAIYLMRRRARLKKPGKPPKKEKHPKKTEPKKEEEPQKKIREPKPKPVPPEPVKPEAAKEPEEEGPEEKPAEEIIEAEVEKLQKKEAARQKPAPKAAAPAKIRGIWDVLEDVESLIGADVTIRGSMWLFNTVTIGEQKVYWYNIADNTGQMLISSDEQLREGEKTVHGKLQKASTGRIYLKFIKFIQE